MAVDRLFARRFPQPTTRGRPPVSTRVVVALECLKQEVTCTDERICGRLPTAVTVMYTCEITKFSQAINLLHELPGRAV